MSATRVPRDVMHQYLTMRAPGDAHSSKHHWLARAIAASLLACATTAVSAATQLTRQDILWLDRITYGPDTAVVDQYLKLGRRKFLAQQLHPADLRLPPTVNTQITALEVTHTDPAVVL